MVESEATDQNISDTPSPRRRRFLLWYGGLLLVGLVVLICVLRYFQKHDTDRFSGIDASLVDAAEDFVAERWPPLTRQEQQTIVAKLKAVEGIHVFHVVRVENLDGIYLDDGRKLKLVFLKQVQEKEKQVVCTNLLRRLFIDSNFVPYATDSGVHNETPELIEAKVAVHTGKMVIAEVGGLLLEDSLAYIDEHSDYAEDTLYSIQAKYYGVGPKGEKEDSR